MHLRALAHGFSSRLGGGAGRIQARAPGTAPGGREVMESDRASRRHCVGQIA